MAIDELRRSNIQALWRHMPEQPFNWRTIASVVGKSPRHVSPLDVPEGWVAPMLRRLVLPFAEENSGIPGVGPELDVIDQRQFELVKAEDLQAERFPNTFLCDKCGRFRSVSAGDEVPSCQQHGRMKQHSFVEVHNCGHLGELRPPRCDNGCRAPMLLLNTHQLKTRNWFWRCVACQTRSGMPMSRHCPTCRRGRVQVTRVPQTSAYYAQQLTVLNPPTRDAYLGLAYDNVHAAAVAQALGTLPPGLDALRRAGQAPEDAVAAFEQAAATIGWKPGHPLYEAGLAEAKSKKPDTPAWRADVDALGLSEELLYALGEECRQLSLVTDAGPLSVDDLIGGAAGTALEPMYHGYQTLFTRYGMTDITLLRELPVAFLVAGYSRGADRAVTRSPSGDPVITQFKYFPAGKSGRFPMYGIRTETEGLLVQLDPVRVVSWLVDCGLVADPHITTLHEARQWLFRRCEPVTDLFHAPPNPVSAAVLALTHSVSHRMMKALAARCGLNVDSLAEYLFPTNAAFLIYANTRSEFILGGLEHVYRYDLTDALTELAAETRCVFDPPCRTTGGACAACLYVFEAACSRFNTVLDRNVLFGTLPSVTPVAPTAGVGVPQNQTWQPYWRP